MRDYRWATALLCVLGLTACNPVFNWREARFDNAPLVALLPCKPDKGVRALPMGDRTMEVNMQGCEAGGVLFTVAVAQLDTAERAGALLKPWKTSMLTNARASHSDDRPFALPGATPWPDAVRARFSGQRPDGQPVFGEVALFARDAQVYQAAVFASQPQTEAANTFFAGLKLP